MLFKHSLLQLRFIFHQEFVTISSLKINYSNLYVRYASTKVAALRSRKKKSSEIAKDFIDARVVRTTGGNGGNGCISLAQLFNKENGGPDGGDAGNGGHVIFQAANTVRGLGHIDATLIAQNGQKGYSKSCTGKNASHLILKVPLGTIFKDERGQVVADLYKEKMMFIAARGGAGGKGNESFVSDLLPAPRIAEFGAEGETQIYTIELSSMAHFGLLGFPNAGKSTLLQAVTRANPKVAAYPFTTLKPHLGVVEYTDYEQLTIADLPGIIEGSHRNKGLGITFLRHAERCMGLLILLDMSEPEPWNTLNILESEVLHFSTQLSKRPRILVANKMDIEGSELNLVELERRVKNERILPISAKHGKNLTTLLNEIRDIYDEQMEIRKKQLHSDSVQATDVLG